MPDTPDPMQLYKAGDFAAFKAAATPEALAGPVGDQILASALFKLRARTGSADAVDFLLDCGTRGTHSPCLWLAIEGGHARAVQLIVEAGASPDEEKYGHDTWQLLHVATRQRVPNADVVRALLEGGAKLGVRNRAGRTPLHHAAEWHQGSDVVEALLEHGAAIDEPDPNGLVPLALAALKSRDAVFDTLISRGADVNAGTFTPLMAAAVSNNARAIAALVAAGANATPRAVNPLVKGYPSPMTAREHAEHANAGDAAAVLSTTGPQTNPAHATPATQYATLHAAARAGDAAAVEEMLASGAYPHAYQDGSGHRPLHVAGSAAVVRLLLASGADPNARADGDVTPLAAQVASKGEHTVECVEALLEGGADVSAAAADGTTALHHAVQTQNTQLVSHLLARGAAAHDGNSPGLQPLHLAAELDNTAITTLLLDAGAPVDALGLSVLGARATPLNLAAQNNAAAVAELLLARGASPDTVDANDDAEFGDYNAVHKAAQWDNFEVLAVLLRDGRGVWDELRSGKCADELAPRGSRSRALLEAVMHDGTTVDAFLARVAPDDA